MDSSAYLTRHGWRGHGHALHPGGIKKPLLISKKADVLGLGKKKNDVHADQWWARAFDSGLKNLEVNQAPGVYAATQTVKSRSALELLQTGGGKWTGLYTSFVKGQGLEGTWTPDAQGPVVQPQSSVELKGSRINHEEHCVDIDLRSRGPDRLSGPEGLGHSTVDALAPTERVRSMQHQDHGVEKLKRKKSKGRNEQQCEVGDGIQVAARKKRKKRREKLKSQEA